MHYRSTTELPQWARTVRVCTPFPKITKLRIAPEYDNIYKVIHACSLIGLCMLKVDGSDHKANRNIGLPPYARLVSTEV